MSLFPSESYSFPDLEGAPKRRKPQEAAAPIEEQQGAPIQESIPEEPAISSQAEELSTEATAEDPVQVEPKTLPKPIVRKPITPIRRVRPVAPARPAPVPDAAGPRLKPQSPQPPRTAPPPQPTRPVPVTKTARPIQRILPVMPILPVVPDQLAEPIQEEVEPELEPELEPIEEAEEEMPVYEFSAVQAEARSQTRRRGVKKLFRFLVLETFAVGVLLVSAKFAVAERFSENSLSYLYGTVMVIAVVAAAVIPVIFYALPPRLPPPRE